MLLWNVYSWCLVFYIEGYCNFNIPQVCNNRTWTLEIWFSRRKLFHWVVTPFFLYLLTFFSISFKFNSCKECYLSQRELFSHKLMYTFHYQIRKLGKEYYNYTFVSNLALFFFLSSCSYSRYSFIFINFSGSLCHICT